jgi:hypothetical protein
VADQWQVRRESRYALIGVLERLQIRQLYASEEAVLLCLVGVANYAVSRPIESEVIEICVDFRSLQWEAAFAPAGRMCSN